MAAYSAAVSRENAVDHLHGEIMLVRGPFYKIVATLLQGGDNGVHSPKDWRVGEDLIYC